MKNKKPLYFVALFSILLMPAPALAHGEQIIPFLGSLGLFIVLSLVILGLLKIEKKLKGLLILIYIILMSLLILSPGTKLLPLTSPITAFLESMIWEYPILTGFLLNSIALGICFSLYLILKKNRKPKQAA